MSSEVVCLLLLVQEVIKTRRDPKNLAVCAECGSPHDLKYCSGCRQVRQTVVAPRGRKWGQKLSRIT